MLESIERFDDCYYIYKNKKTHNIINFITIMFITILIILIYFFFYPFDNIKTYYSTIINEEGVSYVSIKTLSTSTFINSKDTYLDIDGQIVDYEIVDIIDYIGYNEVILKLQLNLEPRILKLKFILKPKTLFERVKEDV